MSATDQLGEIVSGIKTGDIVPYLGPGVLRNVASQDGHQIMPADSDSLILAMNGGTPMAPRLMYEFPRAAMNQELKKGRKFVEKFLTDTYGQQKWQRSRFHNWLSGLKPQYVIDINRDTQLQDLYSEIPHTLIVGTARIAGTDYRYKLYQYDGSSYQAINEADINPDYPTLFKPMGTPRPEPSYIAADADYVDYITELMGGFAIPKYYKRYRMEKQYLFLGMRMTRDTERMVLSDLIYGASKPAGWALIPEPTDKERRFCATRNIELIEQDWEALLDLTPASSMSEKVA
ncbi:MAG: SIR2 family protein [Pseudomonadales bacterium]|nr:SIR2 family protein [Pseudomonadales bacterium]